jgi:hypothetical protein
MQENLKQTLCIKKKGGELLQEKIPYAASERIFAHLPWRVGMPSNSGRATGVR